MGSFMNGTQMVDAMAPSKPLSALLVRNGKNLINDLLPLTQLHGVGQPELLSATRSHLRNLFVRQI